MIKKIQYETPKMKIQRVDLIPDGSMHILTLALPMASQVAAPPV